MLLFMMVYFQHFVFLFSKSDFKAVIILQMALLHPSNEIRLASIDEQMRSLLKFKKSVTYMLQVIHNSLPESVRLRFRIRKNEITRTLLASLPNIIGWTI